MMKTSKKKTTSEVKHDIKSLQECVRQWQVPSGPFDYARRGQAVAETLGFCTDSSRMRQRDPYDADLSELHRHAVRTFHLAMDAAYPPGFDRDCERLRSGDTGGLEGAIRFLEADPMFFRTGYLKTKLIRYIKSGMITPSDAARLQSVVLSVVDTRDDRDFRAFCKLARKVDAPELRQALCRRLTHSDADIRRRARWMLDALGTGTSKKAKQA